MQYNHDYPELYTINNTLRLNIDKKNPKKICILQ